MRQRTPRLSYTADRAGSALHGGGPAPTDPETGLRYPILKVWALRDQDIPAQDSDDLDQAVPGGWGSLGGTVRVKVDDKGGAKDKRVFAVGIRPVYLNLGQYEDVRVTAIRVAASVAPLVSQWLKSVPAGVLLSPLFSPVLVNSSTPSSEFFLPDGARRVRTSVGVTLEFGDSITVSGVVTTKTIYLVTAPDVWYDIPTSSGSIVIQDPTDVFYELDPL